MFLSETVLPIMEIIIFFKIVYYLIMDSFSIILLGRGSIVIGLQFPGSSLGIGVIFPIAHFNGKIPWDSDSFNR